ncbi:hypothetical protein ABZ929_03165 [Streptomyces physcomitrii]|uniref:hypothetical protein n=1 Tax=Streptomyces physcomitrii TaxID=2724184 RepID=UPI0033F91C5E
MSEMKGRELFGHCGLEVVEGQVPATLPAARQAVGITFGGTDPAVVVPLAATDLSDRVDEAWLRLAREHDVVDGAGRFLIATPMDGPWVPVRLGGEVRLAENLTGNHGKPGHAEFVTMALDGSVMCGVTTEDEEVWLVLDRDRIQQPPPPPPDMEAARAATRRLRERRSRG